MELFENKNGAEEAESAAMEEKTTEGGTETAEPMERYEGKSYIFTALSSLEDVMGILCRTFGVEPEGQGDTLILRNQDMEVRVAVACASAGEKAQEFIKQQTEAAWAHFYETKTGAVDVKTNLLYQLERTRGFVLVEYSFEAEDIQDKKSIVEDMFIVTLDELAAVFLISDPEEGEDGFYCCGEDGERLLILSDKGGSAFRRYLPFQGPIAKPGKDITQEQADRRMRTVEVLEEKGIYVPEGYPVIEPAAKVTCRSYEEIAKRAMALMGVSIYSECLAGERKSMEDAQNFLLDFLDKYDTQDYFSPKEWDYIHNTKPDEKECRAFSWQYEDLFTLAWALGLVDKLDFPDHFCDTSLPVLALRECTSISKILAKSRPKSPRELLDACDLICCLDQACIYARQHRLPAPAGMKSGVVRERHRALNWLTGYGNSAPWDEVKTDN